MFFMCNANSGDQLPHWAPVEELISFFTSSNRILIEFVLKQ